MHIYWWIWLTFVPLAMLQFEVSIFVYHYSCLNHSCILRDYTQHHKIHEDHIARFAFEVHISWYHISLRSIFWATKGQLTMSHILLRNKYWTGVIIIIVINSSTGYIQSSLLTLQYHNSDNGHRRPVYLGLVYYFTLYIIVQYLNVYD